MPRGNTPHLTPPGKLRNRRAHGKFRAPREPGQTMTAPKSLIEPSDHLGVDTARDQRSPFWDELRGAVTSRISNGTGTASLAPYGWLALLILTNAVVGTLSGAHDAAQRGNPYSLTRPAYFEITGALATLLLLPLLRRGIHGLGRCRGFIATLGATTLMASLYAVAHIAILIPMRKLSFAIVGGAYHFDWLTQGPSDFCRELIAVMVLGGGFWLFDLRKPASATSTEPRETPAQAEEPRLWLRDGTTAVRVDPRAIVTVASAGNYVEFSLTDRNYLIRGTLAGEETRLRSFGLRRVHRTRLVNLHRVAAVEPRPGGDFILRMDSGELIAGSRRYREAVRAMTAPSA